MFGGTYYFITLAIALFLQNSSATESIYELVCSDRDECSAASNSSISRVSLSSYSHCIFSHIREFVDRQCGVQRSNQYPFSCALKDDGKFCNELINYDTEVPPLCTNISTCTTECRASLLAMFGCCVSQNLSQTISSYTLTQLWEMCAFDVIDACPLAIPPVNVLPNEDCYFEQIPSRRFLEVSSNALCHTFKNYTQQVLTEYTRNSCLDSSWVYGLYLYLNCDQNKGNEYCAIKYSKDIGFNILLENVVQYCNITVSCTPECHDNLIKARAAFGCCANSYMLLLFYSFSGPIKLMINNPFYSCEKRMDIWSHCGIYSPGYCKNSLVFSDGSILNIRLLVMLVSALIGIITNVLLS